MAFRALALLLAAAIAGAAPAADKPADTPKKEGFVLIFDFACPGDEEFGKKLANAVRMRLARHEALAWIGKDPALASPESEPIRRALVKRFKDTLSLIEVG